jgi:hypothetical protein
VKVANGNLIIKWEKQEEKEEMKDYYVRKLERRFGMPESVEADEKSKRAQERHDYADASKKA